MQHTAKAPSVATPTYSFNDDADTGFDSRAADQLDLVCGGVSIVQITSAGVDVTAVDGVSQLGFVYKLEETVAYSAFTDGGGAAGTFALTVGQIPAGATFLFAAVTALVGFTGNTSAVLIIGDGTDTDRYMTGTPSVFTTAATGIDVGDPSGVRYHTAAKTVTLTITANSDWGLVTAGSLTVVLYYLK